MGSIEKAIAKMNENPPRGERSKLQQGQEGEQRPALRVLEPEQPRRVREPLGRPAAIDQRRHFQLPEKTLEGEGIITPDSQRNQMSEEYRAIKRRILSAIDNGYDDPDVQSNIVMLTSCVSGEGKTFSSINLAISIAMERDRSVLLVDADVTNPMAGTRLGFDSKTRGLTDLLLDNTLDPEDYIWQSSLPGLQFLPAGRTHNQVTELLASKSMTALSVDLSRRHPGRVIIIDSAPILMTSESRVVADLAGQVVFVVAANSTTRNMVADALKQVNDHARVGLILNKSRKSIATTYGYGYGYGAAKK